MSASASLVSAAASSAGHPAVVTVQVSDPIVFQPRFRVEWKDDAGQACWSDSPFTIGWLPRGRYAIELPLPGNAHNATLTMVHNAGMREERASWPVPTTRTTVHGKWTIESVPPTVPIAQMSWSRGHADWFFRHFDHAATTVISYLLGDHPLLKGRILDVGCGDGITDLGIALRTQCEELIGLEPFRQYERLPQIVAENNLPTDIIPKNLRFVAEDANFLPFEDNSFDVVVSWGSVEHIAGGYLQALREVKRVLKPDGLFMVAPGLFYSNIGHHLTEFSSEPFFHLKKSEHEIRDLVLKTPPKYIDRSGEFSSNEQFYQWYTELNRITVANFEKEMRALEFAPWRIALRTDALVEYTREIERYPIQDLANTELYSSWFNRKKVRA
jgi:SAM-dependent methyltransferase